LNHFHSNKINTIGDIARLTSTEIENSPLPSPKLENIQKAFSLYQEHLVNSSSMNNTITNTSDKTIRMYFYLIKSNKNISFAVFLAIDDNISSISEAMITNSQDKLYDVETLIDSLDYDVSISNNQKDFKRTKRQIQEFDSPINENNKNLTLGDRLQKAADIYKTNGILPFDDDYIELIRQLFNNSSLTHLEQLHLKTLFLNH
jgi:hypothetical protein